MKLCSLNKELQRETCLVLWLVKAPKPSGVENLKNPWLLLQERSDLATEVLSLGYLHRHGRCYVHWSWL